MLQRGSIIILLCNVLSTLVQTITAAIGRKKNYHVLFFNHAVYSTTLKIKFLLPLREQSIDQIIKS